MQFAYVDGALREPASTGGRAVCPCCGCEVVAKCGVKIVRHWAHRRDDCDPWAEPESEWHRFWKSSAAPPERREVVLGGHRADAVLASGVVVEVQKSRLSPKEIHERESFYTSAAAGLVWVIDRPLVERTMHKAMTCPVIVAGPAGPAASFRPYVEERGD